jgi:hypothetical protein
MTKKKKKKKTCDLFYVNRLKPNTMDEITLMLAIINFVCIMIIFIIVLYIYGRLVDAENNISNLFEYRKYNEIQLQNLIKDVNTNDKYLSTKLALKQK